MAKGRMVGVAGFCSCVAFSMFHSGSAAIVDLFLVNGEYTACPEGYYKAATSDGLNGDLNQGSGGDYLYLCVTTGPASGSEEPITDLAIVSADGPYSCNPEPWYDISHDDASNADLNQGAGGKYIYMCYTKREWASPIEDILLVEGDCPEGYYRITNVDGTGDLNEGAGGKYIFVCAKRGCVATSVLGEWRARYQIATPTEEEWKHGTQKKHTESTTEEWSLSVTATVKQGWTLFGAAGGVEISTTFAESTSQTYSSEWTVNDEYTFKVSWERQDVGKMAWQFHFSPSDSCGHEEQTITQTFALTEGQFRPPCCVPGYATDAPTYAVCSSADVMVPGGEDFGCRVANQAELVAFEQLLNRSSTETPSVRSEVAPGSLGAGQVVFSQWGKNVSDSPPSSRAAPVHGDVIPVPKYKQVREGFNAGAIVV